VKIFHQQWLYILNSSQWEKTNITAWTFIPVHDPVTLLLLLRYWNINPANVMRCMVWQVSAKITEVISIAYCFPKYYCSHHMTCLTKFYYGLLVPNSINSTYSAWLSKLYLSDSAVISHQFSTCCPSQSGWLLDYPLNVWYCLPGLSTWLKNTLFGNCSQVVTLIWQIGMIKIMIPFG